MSTNQLGQVVIISGPSGVGKSTLVPEVLARFGDKLRLSVSATTRVPRPGEVNGENYHFLSPEAFRRQLDTGEFLEAVEVFGRGHWYGTPRSEVTPSLERGVWVILEIDVAGARRVLQERPEAITIFIEPSSLEELERRLRLRKTETEEAIQRRLEVARRELGQADKYQHRVVNRTVETAVDEIADILKRRGLQE